MRLLRSVRRDERGVVVPSRLMVAAIVVVAIAAVMYVATSPGKKDEPARATSSSASTTPSKTASKSPSASPSKTKSAKPSSTPSATPTDKATPAVKRADTFVAVFNNSGRVGLAARTASRVTGSGWKVVGTDNWYGSVPATTVYYPKRLKAAADLLAKDLGVRRVKPAVAPMRNDRLTVILTKDFKNS